MNQEETQEISHEITRSTAIEITPRGATLFEIESSDTLATASVRIGSAVVAEAPLELAESGYADQLLETLRPLVQEFALSGKSISVLLSGAYCSTRIISGDEDAVRRGIQDLEKLKHHYMGLGRGEKALSSVVHRVDARKERATVAVAVGSTLEVLVEVSQRLGVELETVEPSVVGLARLCGYLNVDEKQPVALISSDGEGTDIALSFQGEVALHHRLRAPLDAQGESERVGQQLCLLAQYVGKFSQEARENKLPVYIVSQGTAEDQLTEQLSVDTDLELHSFRMDEVFPQWQCDDVDAKLQDNTALWAAVGGCVRPFIGQEAAPAPDMVHNITGTSFLKIAQARRKMIFPLVAAGLVGIAVGFAAFWESSAAAGLQENLKRFETVEQQLETTKMQLVQTKMFNKTAAAIGAQVSGIDWRRELELLAQCKPAGVWLKRVTLRQDGTLGITGSGNNDAAIYEFKKWLAEAPTFERVELTSTRAGERTEFEMECDIRGRGGY